LEGLLTLFVALTAIAIIAQAVVLVGIYVMSKRLGEQVERFMKETREMMVPVRSIADNLRTASANLVEIGISAREQFRRVEAMGRETRAQREVVEDFLEWAPRRETHLAVDWQSLRAAMQCP